MAEDQNGTYAELTVWNGYPMSSSDTTLLESIKCVRQGAVMAQKIQADPV